MTTITPYRPSRQENQETEPAETRPLTTALLNITTCPFTVVHIIVEYVFTPQTAAVLIQSIRLVNSVFLQYEHHQATYRRLLQADQEYRRPSPPTSRCKDCRNQAYRILQAYRQMMQDRYESYQYAAPSPDQAIINQVNETQQRLLALRAPTPTPPES